MDINPQPVAFLLVCLSTSGSLLTTKGQQQSSCETSGTVLEGEPADIFCKFNRPNQNFILYRPPSSTKSDGNTGKPKIEVVCTWEGDKRTCDLGDHKVTTSNNREQATIEIPSVKQEHSGEYFCKTHPAIEDNASSCTLTVLSTTVRRRNLITCKTRSPVPIGQEASVVCEFSKSIANAGITLTKQGTNPGEILRCDGNRHCLTLKKGYTMQETSDTTVRISIPSAKADDAGDYVCSADLIEGVSGLCTLELSQAVPEKDDETAVLSTTSYTVLAIASVTVILVAGLAGLLFVSLRVREKCRSRQGKHLCSGEAKGTERNDSQTPCLAKKETSTV